jgi:hypothetical protein
MQIHHGLRGERYIVTERPDKSVLVSTGLNRGYLQRPVVVQNRTYVQRTYIVNNVTYTRVYRPYNYRGVAYYHYVPVSTIVPCFMGGSLTRGRRPSIIHGAGPGTLVWVLWRHFAPYPVYPTASLWLTDFLLAETLKLAYQTNVATEQGQTNVAAIPLTAGGNSYATPLPPEVKQAIAEEVRQQLAAEQQAAAASQPQPPVPSRTDIPSALDPRQRVFVVSSNLDERTVDGQECVLTPGDIITRLTDTPDVDNTLP